MKFNKDNPTHVKLLNILSAAHKKGKLKEVVSRVKLLTEEKQRETKYIRNLNTTVYISNKFRQGAGGEDRPKLKMEVSLTPGKTLDLYRLVTDENESNKFAMAIKLELEKILGSFDKQIDDLKAKYSLKVQDDEPTPVTPPAPEATPAPQPEKPAAPAPAPAKPAQPQAQAPKPAAAKVPVKPEETPKEKPEEEEPQEKQK